MRLADWLRDQGLTQAQFAARVGVPPQTISKYVRRTRGARHAPAVPRPELMARIVDATGGAVGPADFYPTSPAAAAHATDTALATEGAA